MKISQLKAGQIVYNVQRRKMGNTNVYTTGVYTIRVVEVVTERENNEYGVPKPDYALASWNSNPPEKFYRREVSKWKKDKPIMIQSDGMLGTKRLATRSEIKEIKAKEAAKRQADQRLMDVIFPSGDSNAKPE